MSPEELKLILAQNPRILLDRKRIRSILCDVFNNDMSRVNSMLAAYDEGIIKSLRANSNLSAVDKSRYTKILIQNHSMVDDRAKWAVDMWNSSFDRLIAAALDAAEAEILQESKAVETKVVAKISQFDFAEEKSNNLKDRSDVEDYFVNPSIKIDYNRIYVPCGVGRSDNGFFIYGIKKALVCEHPNANTYALIYNYLIRNSLMSKEDIPRFLKAEERLYEIDYRSVFRTTIILLQLIKNNYCSNGVLELAYRGEVDNLKTAIRIIDTYEALFSRLMSKEPVKLSVRLSAKGLSVSLEGNKGIYACNNDEFISNAREIWYGRKINYKLTRANLNDIEYILTEISPFDSFKEGQFEVLCKMVSAKKHTVCIMPTGSGKSLIYYFISILQPLPILIISPTDILIKDQIRNLWTIHRIDNVAHLQLTADSFSCYEMFNSLNYVTPTTLQNVNLFYAFKQINKGSVERHQSVIREYKLSQGALFSFVALDEIHCLSNWGHDFRPEYLMLSKSLNKYLDQITFLGFTATANFTVAEDVQKQLGIPQENFISPIAYENNNISYEFKCVNNQYEMYSLLGKISKTLIDRNERTIIFTKSDEISRKVAEAVGYEASMFLKDDTEAYHHFVDQKCKVLVASEELGIGINFPNIRNIIHFGLPLSKSKYIQEVGRAGRANEQVHSYIIYLSAGSVPGRLLKRDTQINEIPILLQELDNDFADAYRKLTNNSPTSDILYKQLESMYHYFNKGDRPHYVETYLPNEVNDAKQKIYMLYAVGYIDNWYTYSMSKDDAVNLMIDVKSSDTDAYRKNPNKMFMRMKNRIRNYFEELGSNRESIAKVDRATSQEEIIRIYVDWYYAKYLYHHNEQFLDLYEFVINSSQNSEEVTSLIKEYFSLPFVKLKSDETLYNEMNMKEIGNKVLAGLLKSTVANIERINSNRYSYKFDFLLFAASLKHNGIFEQNRLERIQRYTNSAEHKYIADYLPKLYVQCGAKGRLAIVNYIESSSNSFEIGLSKFLDKVYKSEPKDMIYYGFMARVLNDIFDISRRNHYVR